MKGIVFNVLEAAVSEAHGEQTWDALVEGAGVSGSYTALGSYPDEELFAIVGAASKALSLPAGDVVRWFGRNAIRHFHQRYPQFFDAHSEVRPFLLTLNDIIHPEVRKLYPGASVPDFDFQKTDDGGLRIGYSSAKKLCSLAEGLIEGAAAHYHQPATLSQERCMNRGDSQCVIVCSFGHRTGS